MLNFPIKWGPDPLFFEIGILKLGWYGLFFAGGIAVGYRLMETAFKKKGYPEEYFHQLALYVILGIIIGARVGHCVFYDWAYFSQHPWEIFLPVKFEPQLAFIGFRGLASHGGAVGVASALYGFYRRTQGKVSMPFVLDQLARIAPIPCASIRLGNLMNSEIIGLPTEVPWAFVFTRIDEVPRHPAQLYEAFAYVMGFFLLRWVYHKSLHRYPLSTFALMLIYMFSARFILEFFKENQMAFESMLPLNMGQLLSLPFILVGATLWVYARRTKLQT